MNYYILIQSLNDLITNSSTEILTVLSEKPESVLKEIILNYAYQNEEDPSEDDVSVWEVNVDEMIKDLYGELPEQDISRLKTIYFKTLGLGENASGILYRIEIDKTFCDTEDFLRYQLGAV